MKWTCILCVLVSLCAATLGTVRGVVHDPQHRPLQNATITVQNEKE